MSLPFAARCPVCGATDTVAVLHLERVPVFCNVLFADRDEALRAPRADIEFVQCRRCSLVYNVAFDPDVAAYAPGYENSLHHSATFREFSRQLVERLAEQRSLAGKTVVEIGSGGGAFLTELCAHAGCRGLGFDPSRAGDESDGSVTIKAAPFPIDGDVEADMIVSRHVFEHLHEPVAVSATVGRALDRHRNAMFYVEVPDGRYMLRETALWDVIYEHCTYFTRPSLVHLLAATGMTTVRCESSFGDQYLWAEAVSDSLGRAPVDGIDAEIDELLQLAAMFGPAVRRQIDSWNAKLQQLAEKGPVAVWGTGSKGVTFLNVLPAAQDVRWVVDLNPLKHGKFVPTTGHEVVGPDRLVEDPPATVVVMNPIYRDEIESAVRAMGIDADVVVAI